jgi:hypothetical protein
MSLHIVPAVLAYHTCDRVGVCNARMSPIPGLVIRGWRAQHLKAAGKVHLSKQRDGRPLIAGLGGGLVGVRTPLTR